MHPAFNKLQYNVYQQSSSVFYQLIFIRF